MITAAYLKGAITHAITRARDLIEITQSGNAMELRGLQSTCSRELEDVTIGLAQALDALEQGTEKISSLMRVYQTMAKRISDVERFGVFSLKNQSQEDADLNRILNRICGEISYPLVPPTVSHTSQRYFEILPVFNLMRVPLIEGRYLTQLPDLYHELCHPLLSLSGHTNPKLEGVFETFRRLKNKRAKVLNRAILDADRRRGAQESIYRNALWRKCWIETWCEEFFCDAFAAFCAGPAYGWTNYHLCIRTDAEIFHVPTAVPRDHPADHARMLVILAVLRDMGHAPDAEAMEKAWLEYAKSKGLAKPNSFDLCFPTEFLDEIASSVKTALEKCGLKGHTADCSGSVASLLQDAWHMFWNQNTDYEEWEKTARRQLQKAAH